MTPSLLNCDFARIAEELEALKRGGVVAVHLDVMDGHFVPNLSYGAPVISRLAEADRFPVRHPPDDVRPGPLPRRLRPAGCDVIIFHIEVVPEPVALLRRIRAAGLPGVAGAEPADAGRRRSSRSWTRWTRSWS